MATENAIFDTSSPFTVSSGNCTISSGNLDITSGNLTIPVTTSATIGVITQAGSPVWITKLNTNIIIGATLATIPEIAGNYNIAIGARSFYPSTTNTCAGNVFLGWQSGYRVGGSQSESNNVGIGSGTIQGSGSCIRVVEISGVQNYSSNNSSYIRLGVNRINKGNATAIGASGVGDIQNDCWIAGIYSPASALGSTQKILTVDNTTLATTFGKLGGLAGGIGTILMGGTKPTFSAAGSNNQTLIATTSAAVSWSGSPSWTGTTTASSGNVVITSGNLALPTTTATVGQIVLNGNAFLQSYGTNNTFIGTNSGNLTLNTANATDNTAVGYIALLSLSGTTSGKGKGNSTYSNESLNSCTDGSYDSSYGYQSQKLLTTGTNCTSIGYQSLAQCLNSVENTALGYRAGNSYTGSESSNISIGSGVTGTTSESNVLRIGAGTGTGTNQINAAYISGIQGITVTGAAVFVSTSDQLGIAVSSKRFKDNINDMIGTSEKLMKLRPVSFNYKKDENKTNQYGFIAEEVEKIFPELVNYDENGIPFSVYYEKLPVMLLKEIQKLNNKLNYLERYK